MKSQRILRSEGEAFFTVIIGHWIWLITDFHYGNVTENDKNDSIRRSWTPFLSVMYTLNYAYILNVGDLLQIHIINLVMCQTYLFLENHGDTKFDTN
ncbi:hypothetical protein RhiirA4_52588 [Rhizophagus irregularis]|uniref:Uncharacterized protein n=1 Tax=Rhizophagus irregularis TaxID=588596 RepID=A0A2I1H5F8_9GLOM|nr:hypothetical protein RhiirA4_52588 [Rhizophagus irregularis]